MRANSRNPLQKVLDLATRQTLAKLRAAGLIGQSAQFGASTPPHTITASIETEDGEILTDHIFMLGLDTLGAADAHLCVEGKTKDYGS